MNDRKIFAEGWKEAHRERSQYVWSLIRRMMASPRTPTRSQPAADDDQQSAQVDAVAVKQEP
jgi:hypothetical protein